VDSSDVSHADDAACTDAANADRFVDRFGADFRFVVEWDSWIAWNGKRWIDKGAKGRLYHAVMVAARAAYREVKAEVADLEEALRKALLLSDPDEKARIEARLKWQKALLKHHEQSQNSGSIAACMTALSSRLTISIVDLDHDPWMINVGNGTIDLRTAELLPHTREHYITQQTHIPWVDGASCPTWDAFLRTAMGGDMQLVLYLARAIGYSLTGHTTEQCLFFLYGRGSNGKSTFLGLVKEMLGDYACSAPRDLLMTQKMPKHETEMARLLGKRIATGAEVGDGQRFDEPKVKDLTGSDVIAARRMQENFWDLTPTHKLWLAGNYRPTIIGADIGIWRRIRLIPWLVTITESMKDRELANKLRRELPGIMRWAVHGCLEWQRIGLGEPPSVVEATETYRVESDVLGSYFADACVFERDATISRAALRESYERWCKEAGHEPVGARRLAERLREHSVIDNDVRDGNRVRNGWRGVRLLTEAELYARSLPSSDASLS
jgi:putative DNA primase/helicase